MAPMTLPPACEILIVWPLTVMTSDRGAPGFCATAKPTSEAPVPDFNLSATHDGALSTDQAQPVSTLTLNEDEPPSIGIDSEVGLSESTQVGGGGAAAS
jgi:hypothetical protein